MREIQLTQGKAALVDDLDYEYLNQWKWFAHKARRTFYAVRWGKYKDGKRNYFQMHRVILGLTNPQILADHRDHNGLNNQRLNLRIATTKQNNANTNSRKNSTSKYLGVNLFKCSNSGGSYQYWQASIGKDGKKIHIGLFKSEEEAARVYDEAAKKYHGEFANLNFK